jgi:hypothetical protein
MLAGKVHIQLGTGDAPNNSSHRLIIMKQEASRELPLVSDAEMVLASIWR